MRERGGGGAHTLHRRGLGAREASAQHATVRLLRGGRDAAEPVGLEGGGGNGGRSGLARDGVENRWLALPLNFAACVHFKSDSAHLQNVG